MEWVNFIYFPICIQAQFKINSCLSKKDVFRRYNLMHTYFRKYYPLNKCLGIAIRSTISLLPLGNTGKRLLLSFPARHSISMLTIPLAFRTSQCVPYAFDFQEECQNYIRVLLVGGDRLFTCGTNAFTPVCTIRSVCFHTKLQQIYTRSSKT